MLLEIDFKKHGFNPSMWSDDGTDFTEQTFIKGPIKLCITHELDHRAQPIRESAEIWINNEVADIMFKSDLEFYNLLNFIKNNQK